jgi:hypothetical protein
MKVAAVSFFPKCTSFGSAEERLAQDDGSFFVRNFRASTLDYLVGRSISWSESRKRVVPA